jgi:hypothetical protein
MKILLILLITNYCFSQTANYNKINTEGNYKEYISKKNISIKIGDTINIKYPLLGDRFVYITQGNSNCGTILANTKNIIKKIKIIKNKAYIIFAGYGLINIYIEYESALDNKEIE